MFDEKNEPVDILADVDKVVPMKPVSSAGPAPETRVVRRGPSVLLLFIILAALGGIGYGGYRFFARGKSADAPVAPLAPTSNEPKVNGSAQNAPAPTSAPTPTPEPTPTPAVQPPANLNTTPTPPPQPDLNANIPPANVPQPTAPVQPPEPVQKPVDSDGDGLSDAEEIALGTNPQSADTDSDGLTDFDEVKIYGTDPKNPDTDGDGFLDGAEVKAGFNPKGPGKLFQVPTTPTK
jgi:hypothetical protein